MSGIKHDEGKTRYDLIPAEELELLAQVYTLGSKKYSDRNWEQGLAWSRLFGAAMRHLWAFWRKEENDPETGLPHAIHAAFNCLALAHHIRLRRDKDDRPADGAFTYPPPVYRQPEPGFDDRTVITCQEQAK